MSRSWWLFLGDMIASAESVLSEVDGLTREEFDADERVRKIILLDLLTLGEAAKHIPEEVRARYPEITWRKIVGLRDVIAHSYYRLDEDVIWNIATTMMGNLRSVLVQIAGEEHPEELAGGG
ncbi:MAG TPA: DUF86 domain-containing protein [Longimicrobium sp.]